MPSWAASPYVPVAVAALLLAVLVIAAAPAWLILLTLALIVAAAWLTMARRRAREQRLQAEFQRAFERLASGAASHFTRAPASLADAPPHLEALADELAARIDALSDAAQAAQAHLDAAPDPLLVIDDQDVIRACNIAAAELLQRPLDRIQDRPTNEIFTHVELHHIIAQARRSGTIRLQLRIPLPDGFRIWEVAAAPSRRDVVLALRDATDQARALQVKADFVANASHELRTPIAALRAAVDTLATLDQSDPAMAQRITTMIAQNVSRLEEMARDLLDLSRVEAPDAPIRRISVRASELAANLTAMFEGICRERNLTLSFDLAPEVENLTTDPDLLNLILRNLIDNATRFAFEGTQVRIVARPLATPTTPTTPADRNPQTRGIRFEVIDRGPGIPLAAQERIFERYFQVDTARTTSAHRRGSGLGLAIVKHAARRLGGAVRVNSVWQQGTTMIVELPDIIAVRD